MKNQRDILSIIDQTFEETIKLDWFGFLHNAYSYDSNSGSFYRKTESSQKVDIILYSYGWDGDWKKIINPYLNLNRIQSWIVFEDVAKILFSILKLNTVEFVDNIFYGLNAATLTAFPHLNKNQNWLAPNDNDLVLYNNNKPQIDNIQKTSDEIFEYLKVFHFPFFERVMYIVKPKWTWLAENKELLCNNNLPINKPSRAFR